ncbi:MAG: winged helix-turn-helix domain-containing protein [Bacillota bacterium]
MPGQKILVNMEITLDTAKRQAYISDEEISLAVKEFDLLQLLMENKGRIITREQILENIWSGDNTGDGSKIDVHIRWLREKIEKDPGNPEFIITVRNHELPH